MNYESLVARLNGEMRYIPEFTAISTAALRCRTLLWGRLEVPIEGTQGAGGAVAEHPSEIQADNAMVNICKCSFGWWFQTYFGEPEKLWAGG